MAHAMRRCHACNTEVQHGLKLARKDECLSCGADLYCCLNCIFFDQSTSKKCKEPVAELVKDKAKANFCSYFSFSESHPGTMADSGAEKARKALEGLFRK